MVLRKNTKLGQLQIEFLYKFSDRSLFKFNYSIFVSFAICKKQIKICTCHNLDPPRDSITTTPKPNKSVTSNSRNNIEFSGKLEKPIKLNATLSKSKTVAKMQDHIGCPSERNTRFQLFPLACKRHEDCLKFGNEQRCCDLFGSKRCVEGQSKPLIDDLNHERK